MNVFLGVELITGMMIGLEFRQGVAILDLLIVRFYLGVFKDGE